MTYEHKDGECALFSKQSKNGTSYWGGEITIDGVAYWVNMFDKTSKSGVEYKSLLVSKKGEAKPAQKEEQKPALEGVPSFNDEIPW